MKKFLFLICFLPILAIAQQAVDLVKMPVKIANGEDGLLENTGKGIQKIGGLS